MLTKLEHRILSLFTYLVAITQSFPFSWRAGSESSSSFLKVTTARARWQKTLGALNLLLSAGQALFFIARLVPGPFGGYTTEEYRSLHYTIVIHAVSANACMCILVMQIGAYLNTDDLAVLSNQLLDFNRRHGKECSKAGEFAPANVREKIIGSQTAYIVFLHVIVLPSFALIVPLNKFTLYSAVPEQLRGWATFALSCALFTMFWTRAVIVNWYSFSTGYAYILTNKYWLGKICKEWFSNAYMRKRALSTYHSLFVLNTMYNNGYANVLVPALKSSLELSGMACLVVAIHFRDSMSPMTYAAFMLCGPFCLMQTMSTILYMSLVHELSGELQLSFGRAALPLGEQRCRRLEDKKDVVACKPIFCRIGVLFFVEKSTKVDYISYMVDTFISLLLAMPK